MVEYNDREKLIDILAQKCRAEGEENGVPPCNKEYCDDNKKFCYGLVADTLLANGVTVQKHAKWEKAKYIEAPVYVCSECGNREPLPRKFCPECEAMMDALTFEEAGRKLAGRV